MNIDTPDEPLTRKAFERPVRAEHDIDDVAAFLATLTDGYDPKTKQARFPPRIPVALDLKDKNCG
ncbi:hypothetical protein CI15_05055 [Paraburkholderia monticola]|uniref:Uncharacterized protein n=1 Tax=Paraburkholderia monticola TaxID=1399968 RepID=A0A149PX01_9BURK|nr:hypothetical protein [Paraburkholderia monticola]KXU89568.1 hypothetical protein CI15_05055 [Paraburkholderia monticola]